MNKKNNENDSFYDEQNTLLKALRESERKLQASEKSNAELQKQLDEAIEDLKLAREELLQRDRTRNRFLANISNSLRTPLNSILGNTELLTEGIYGELNGQQKTLIKNIDGSAHKMISLIRDIIDLTELEAGKFDLEIAPIFIQDFCRNCLNDIKDMLEIQRMSSKKFKIEEVSVTPNAIGIFADELRLKRILINLLTIAIHFVPEDGVIKLLVEGDKQSELVRFEISNSGQGIEESNLIHLFKPFIDLQSGVSKRHYYNGVTLPLTYRLTELHGGSIEIKQGFEGGNQFIVTLPWSKNSQKHKYFEDKKSQTQYLSEKIPKAVVVEDSRSAAQKIKLFLTQKLSIRVTLFSEESALFENILEVKPDIVFLDLILNSQMPQWEVLRALKTEPATKEVPIIITSVMDERDKAYQLGADGYLVKPFNLDDLIAAISRVTRNKENDLNKNSMLSHIKPLGNCQEFSDSDLILIADDNQDCTIMWSDFFSQKGFRVLIAHNGIQVLNNVEKEIPKVIVMDIQMPEMDGIEATLELRKRKKFQEIPVIAVTALSYLGDKERCLRAGVNEYLTKPINLNQLHNIICTLIHDSSKE